MKTVQGLNSKNALEYLIYLNDKNIVTISRELKITPQQFNDWLKHRRPIPSARLSELTAYFSVPETILVDEHRYVKRMSALDMIELEMLMVANYSRKPSSGENKSELKYRMKTLKVEREKQLRIARLSALLEKNDSKVITLIDNFLDELERL